MVQLHTQSATRNHRNIRKGHLFQGRFKSILVDADEYLKQLSRYIHLNPVRAKLVEHPADHPWSSYPVYIGKAKSPDWLETDWLLSQFGKNRKGAEKNYKDFVEKVDIKKLENPEKELTGGFILGTPDFVNWVKETFLSNRSDEKEIPQLRQLKPMIKTESIVEAVCRTFDCNRELILKKGRKNNLARDLTIYLARELTGETGKSLGEYFGNISGAAITGRYNYISSQMNQNRSLKAQAKRLRKQIVNN